MSDFEKSDEVKNEQDIITLEFWHLFKNNALKYGCTTNVLDNAKYKLWKDAIRLMMDVDGVPVENIRKIYRMLNVDDKMCDEFWSKTIMSTRGLRRNYNKIIVRYGKQQRGSTSGATDEELLELFAKHAS